MGKHTLKQSDYLSGVTRASLTALEIEPGWDSAQLHQQGGAGQGFN